jgi:hypothetical protein
MSTLPKRIGRPLKPPSKGKRAPLSLLVRPDIKRDIDKLATANGRTQSAEAEALLERALAVESTLKWMGPTLPKLKQELTEAYLREQGYTWVYTPHGKAFYPRGHPAAPPPSDFIPPKEAS